MTEETAASNGTGLPVLEGKNVTVTFGGIKALTNVNVSFDAGAITGVIGPNGAGKTTFFDTLTGVTHPTSGSIFLDGVDVTKRSAVWRAQHGVRRTFQRQQTFGWLPVEDNVLVALEWHGGGGGLGADLLALPSRRRREKERRERVMTALELCGIASLAKVPAANLPVGRARLVEVARAIVDHPRVLLLDEPTSGMEQSEVENLAEVIHRLRKEEGCAVILVEHDVHFVMRHCERVVVLELGEVIADGLPEAVRNDEKVRAAYLG